MDASFPSVCPIINCYAAETSSQILVSVYAQTCHVRAVGLNCHLKCFLKICDVIRARLFLETTLIMNLVKTLLK